MSQKDYGTPSEFGAAMEQRLDIQKSKNAITNDKFVQTRAEKQSAEAFVEQLIAAAGYVRAGFTDRRIVFLGEDDEPKTTPPRKRFWRERHDRVTIGKQLVYFYHLIDGQATELARFSTSQHIEIACYMLEVLRKGTGVQNVNETDPQGSFDLSDRPYHRSVPEPPADLGKRWGE